MDDITLTDAPLPPGRGGDIIFQPGRPGVATGEGNPLRDSIPPRGGDIVFRDHTGADVMRIHADGRATVGSVSLDVRADAAEVYDIFREWLRDARAHGERHYRGDGEDLVVTGGDDG